MYGSAARQVVVPFTTSKLLLSVVGSPPLSSSSACGCCLALVAALEDTNLLHRGGEDGYHFARDAAARFDAAGGVAQDDWFAQAEALHRAFVARRLSPGGAADLLAMTLFVDRLERGL